MQQLQAGGLSPGLVNRAASLQLGFPAAGSFSEAGGMKLVRKACCQSAAGLLKLTASLQLVVRSWLGKLPVIVYLVRLDWFN